MRTLEVTVCYFFEEGHHALGDSKVGDDELILAVYI